MKLVRNSLQAVIPVWWC